MREEPVIQRRRPLASCLRIYVSARLRQVSRWDARRGAAPGALVLFSTAMLAVGGVRAEGCSGCGNLVLPSDRWDGGMPGLRLPVYWLDTRPALAAVAEDDEDESLPVPLPAAPATPSPPVNPPAAPAASGLSAAPAGERPAAKKAARWRVPPIPWRGSYRLSYSRIQADGGAAFTGTNHTISLSGRSYVWQPWFAQLDGAVSLDRGSSTGGGSRASTASHGFDLGLGLLPASRFPLSLGYSQSNSTVRGSTVSDVVTQRFSAMQRYVPIDNKYNLFGRYENFRFRDTAGGLSVTDTFGANLGVPLPGANPQSFGLNASGTRGRAPDGRTANNGSLSVNHSIYLEDYVMNARSEGSINESRTATDRVSIRNFSEIWDWIPSDDYPLRLDGVLRAIQSSTGRSQAATGGVQENTIAAYSGNLRANYRVDQNWYWQLSGTAVHTAFESADSKTSLTAWTTNGSVNWQGDGRRSKLGNYDYTLGYGSGLSASVQGQPQGTDGALSWNAFGTQGLSRPLIGAEDRPLGALNFGQTYSVSAATDGRSSRTLTHNAGVSYALSSSSRGSLSAQLSATDNRTFSDRQTTYQSLTASLFGNRQLGGYELLTANLSAGANRQTTSQSATDTGSTGDGVKAPWVANASGLVGYTNRRFAKVSGLIYTANYTANLRQQGVVGTDRESGYLLDHRFTQRLDWQMGLLAFQLENTFTYTAGHQTGSLLLSVTRNFGGVL